jgi:hypothetical protein
VPEYALTLHFGAPDEATARKRAGDIADLTAAEHGTRNPVVVPVAASELERLRGELAEARAERKAEERTVADLRDELDGLAAESRARLDAAEEDIRRARSQRDEQRQRGEQAEAERDALKAAIEQVEADAVDQQQKTGTTRDRWQLGVYAQASRTRRILRDALDAPSGTDSTGDVETEDRS